MLENIYNYKYFIHLFNIYLCTGQNTAVTIKVVHEDVYDVSLCYNPCYTPVTLTDTLTDTPNSTKMLYSMLAN